MKPRCTFIPVKKDSGMVKVSPSASQEVHRSLLSLQVIEISAQIRKSRRSA